MADVNPNIAPAGHNDCHKPSCPACGVEYSLHACMTGTCRSLQNTLIRLRLALRTLRQIASGKRNTMDRRNAIATLRFMENSNEGERRLLKEIQNRSRQAAPTLKKVEEEMSEPFTAQENNFRAGRVRMPDEYSPAIGADGMGYCKLTPAFKPLPIGGYQFRAKTKPRKFKIPVTFKFCVKPSQVHQDYECFESPAASTPQSAQLLPS